MEGSNICIGRHFRLRGQYKKPLSQDYISNNACLFFSEEVYLLGLTPGRITGRATSRTSPINTGSSSGVTMHPAMAASVIPVRSTHSLMFLLSAPIK